MRIIAGEYRGMRLASLDGKHTRPTADRVREAIFSSLANRVYDARIWDVFAGTGALGLEALSRGSSETIFTEQHPKTLKVLEENIYRMKAEKRSQLIKGDVFQAIKQGRISGKFDLIFIDPPYAAGLYEKIFKYIQDYEFLNKNGMIIVENAKKSLFLADDKVFLLYKRKIYGESCIQYLILKNNSREE